ncbi:uncharacterized protein C2orf42 homolog isoform X1 [Nerophis lumbriciformis]|uniref:uncharacterized protein C2orf42 homolog isoform X1 n=1 Tax=Nerophis lumbriciformis TaxID=546530 RepID=UPI002AE04C47|nr:uncharacterized protein C2orf42 homolog [Nerophis lumbriciformis]
MESASSSAFHVPPPSTKQTPTTPNLAAKQRDIRKAPSSVTPGFLADLGRATLRGIRKCPQCGVYNGTRGLSCKNAVCGISLRNASAEARRGRKDVVEAVKVIIDGEEKDNQGAQVFSVCQRGRGGAQFGFVELVATDAAIATGDRASLLSHINLGRCFMAACKQGQKASYDSPCVHIKQAAECGDLATPLSVKSSVLEALQASVQAKEELWRLATESPGPLVQRVSRDTLVVKCHPDPRHSHGLLHLTVAAGGRAEAQKSDVRQQAVFRCACQAGGRRGRADGAEPAGGPSEPCLHFYACVCALASDEKLAAEFAAFINSSLNGVLPNSTCRVIVPCERPPLHSEAGKSPHKAKKLRQEETLSGGGGQAVDEHSVSLGFHQWLAGVTERIHQTMHYQFDGKPQPLVYHIPQQFFNALQHRLSLGSKRRLPNITTVVVRNDTPPLGSFSKYTWHITNLAQVKRIFDTPELQLELTQSFVKNGDGSYSRFRCLQPPPELDLLEGLGPDRPPAIRPRELQTFLRVGSASDDPKDGRPFEIEWTPDVLPLCHVGELRISFEFGHQQSGHQADSSECSKSNATQVPSHAK